MKYLPFHEALEDCSRLAGKVPQASCLDEGDFPVIGQGKQPVEGFTNDSGLVYRGSLPVILFGDHTAAFKFIDQPFARGADGTKLFRPRTQCLDGKFAWHFLQTAKLPETGYDRKTKYLESLKIPLPPLEEQRRIAAILDKASSLELLALRQQITIEEAEAHLFLDYLGSPFPKQTRWPVVRLCELGLLERGVSRHRPRNDPSLMNGPYPFVQTGDVAGCHRVIESFNSTYSEKGLTQSRLWPKGTLCITIAANIAKTGILGFEACFPDSVVGFQSDRPACITYVQCWMGFLQKHIEKMAPESAQKNINLEILRELHIPLPHAEALTRFHEQVLSLRRLWGEQRSRREKIAEMNFSLSSQLLGES
jgi:type I restriction enzyme, S subunit